MSTRLPPALVARLRKEVEAALGTLAPAQAQALRARFGLDTDNKNNDDASLLALAEELSRLRRSKQKG